MIDKDNRWVDMLKNVIEQNTIILNDLNKNGKTHYKYMLEKLERAKWDLDIMVKVLKEYEKDDSNE